jgi:hypothetical protein
VNVTESERVMSEKYPRQIPRVHYDDTALNLHFQAALSFLSLFRMFIATQAFGSAQRAF